MSKAQQLKLNVDLSDKLAAFLITQPNVLKKFTGCSYVVFSKTNQKLNKLNYQLMDELINEGKTVIKAEETNNINSPWVLTPYYN